MAKFSYSAQDKQGKMQTGIIEASSKDAVKQLLTKQELRPILIKEQKKGFDPNNIQISFLTPKRVNTKDLVVFTRQLSTMVNAGVPLVRALATLQLQTDNQYFKEIIGKVSKDVESGIALADAFEKHPKAFSQVYVNMVRAGEAGGILDDILKRLAYQQEKESSMRKKIKSASVYPMVLLTITLLAFFGLMIFVVPRIESIIKDLSGEDATLPIYTEIMISLSDFMVAQWYLFIAIILGGAYMFRRYIKTKQGRKNWHALLLRMPIFSTVTRKIAIARFSRTFASLMGAGVGMLDSLEVTGRAVGNVVIQEELIRAAKEVKNGRQLSEPLANSAYFPPIVSQMLSIGEETGQVDTILVKVADFYEEEVDAVIDGLSSIIEPVMIVVLGSMVGLIAASVMGPISSLAEQI